MSRTMRFQIMVLVLVTAMFAVISACSPPKTSTKPPASGPVTDTPAPEQAAEEIAAYGRLCRIGLSHIQFPDGSELYLDPETKLEIVTISDPAADGPSYEVVLRQGRLIILSQSIQDLQFTVISPAGYLARLVGSLMYVEIEGDPGIFRAICIEGTCVMGPDPESLLNLPAGSEGWLNETGELQGPFEVDLAALREGCGEDYISVVIPPTPTPDLGATATAFCGEFESENPGTPCP